MIDAMTDNKTNTSPVDGTRTYAWQAVEQLRAVWEAVSTPSPTPTQTQSIPDDYDKTELELVCKYGDIPALQALIAGGLDIQTDIDALLIAAIENKHIEFAGFLLDQGADIHASDEYPLEVAALSGDTEMVRFLLDHDADIHADDDTILNWATQATGSIETIALLIERGASVENLDPEHRARYDNYQTDQLTAYKKAGFLKPPHGLGMSPRWSSYGSKCPCRSKRNLIFPMPSPMPAPKP
jgi:ankyrin repeat protein